MLSILLSWKSCGTNILVPRNFILSHLPMLSFFLALLVSHHLSSFACRGTQTSRHLPKCSGPLWREIRRIPGPRIACAHPPPFPPIPPLPSRALEILRGLSTYAFVTYVSQTAATVIASPPMLHDETKSHAGQLQPRCYTTESGLPSYLNC